MTTSGDSRPTLYDALGKTLGYEAEVASEKRAHLIAASIQDNRLVRQSFIGHQSLTGTVNEMVENMGRPSTEGDERDEFEKSYANRRELLRSLHSDTIRIFPVAPYSVAASWSAFKYKKLWSVAAVYHLDIIDLDFHIRREDDQARINELLKHPEHIQRPVVEILTIGRSPQDSARTLFSD